MKTRTNLCDLELEILGQIFVEAQNLNLITVSRGFYEASQSTTVQANFICTAYKRNYYYGYLNGAYFGIRNRSDFVYAKYSRRYFRLIEKENLALAIINKGIYPERWINVACFIRALEYGWVKALNTILRLYKAKGISDFEPQALNTTQIHSICGNRILIEPILRYHLEIQGSVERTLGNSGNVELLKILMDAHNIQLTITQLRNNFLPDEIKPLEYFCEIVKLRENLITESNITNIMMRSIRKNNHQMFRFILQNKSYNHTEYLEILEHIAIYGTRETITVAFDYVDFKKIYFDELLEIALASGNSNISEFLIDEIEAQVRSPYIKLYNSISKGDFKLVMLLLEIGSRKHIFEPENKSDGKISSSESIKEILCQLDEDTVTKCFKTNYLEFVMLLIENGCNPNISSGEPLRFAINNANYEVAEYLIMNGANIYNRNSEYLRGAIRRNDMKSVTLIFENSAFPHKNMDSELEYLLLNKNTKMVKSLIENSNIYKRENIKVEFDHSMTTFIENNYTEIPPHLASILIDNGADIQTEIGSTLLENAIKNNNEWFIEYLLSRNVKIDLKNLNQLYYFCRNEKNFELIKKIVDSGSLNQKEMKKSSLISLKNRQFKIFMLFILYGMRIESFANIVLVLACKGGSYEIAEMALHAGASVSFSNNESLYFASLNGYQDIVSLLISHGANQEILKEAEFLVACRNGNLEKVSESMKGGYVSANCRNGLGLVWAAINNHDAVVECLLRYGANPNLRRSRALLIACRRGFYRIVKILIEYDVDVMARNNQAIILAAKMDNMDVVNLLLKNKVDACMKKGRAVYWIFKNGSFRSLMEITEKKVPDYYLIKSIGWAFFGKNICGLEILHKMGLIKNARIGSLDKEFLVKIGWSEGRNYLKCNNVLI
ncbi:hypothetical protein BB558_001540 [Smittium angustum]|uniref:Uncharacterized protein n=1 Tax=Smittium angustum TaxID=133377 RepID=A0A2U1JBK0_SMIAN|nr:hypothetical protein BB558_001540 [Smittium angustum]